MSASMLVFWGLVIWGVVTVVRSFNRLDPEPGGRVSSDPEQILRERYARGEIDEEEYERRRRTLHG